MFLILLLLWCFFFLALPLKILRPRTPVYWYLIIFLSVGFLATFFPPLSSKATTSSDHTHCGALTYAGALHPIKAYLSPPHQEDLEVRNQLCWLRKLILLVPSNFEREVELEQYQKIIRPRLNSPQRKFTVSSPWVLTLTTKTIFSWNSSSPYDKFIKGKLLVQNLFHWERTYKDRISEEVHLWWAWPQSFFVRFEYGNLEANVERFREKI
jgi:hypothetical protein